MRATTVKFLLVTAMCGLAPVPRVLSVDPGDLSLGQPSPGPTPAIFSPGRLSHGFHELGIRFSPTGDEIFYIMADSGYQHYSLVKVARHNGQWGSPEVAEFARRFSVNSVCFGPDGRSVFFAARPAGTVEPNNGSDIFTAIKTDGTWKLSGPLGTQINSDQSETSVAVAEDRTLYFSRNEPGKPADIWSSVWDGERYLPSTRLGAPVNSEKAESRPFVAPDQSYLLFQSDREDSLGVMDIYITVRRADGSWNTPSNLGPGVNSTASDFGPSVSPDGRHLFFSSYRKLQVEQMIGRSYDELLDLYRRPENGCATIYWVNASVIGEFVMGR